MNKKNKNQAKFIKTQDLDTAESMKKAGFELVGYSDETWTFINNPNCPLTFEANKIAYSDMLCI